MSFLNRVLTRQLRAVTALLALGIVAGLLMLGAQPFAVGLVPAPWDKLAHAGVFSVLAGVIGLASGLRGWQMFALALGGVLLVGGLDEWHQLYLPGRQAGLDDLAADAAGGLVGVALLAMYRRKKCRSG